MKKSKNDNGPEMPSDDELHALYAATNDFIAMAPWEWMYDSDLFGVQDPESGEVGYCCVLGHGGESFGLNVFQGPEGLMGFWAVTMVTPEAVSSVGGLQRCLSLALEDRATLRPGDLATIKRLGLKYRGRNAWPVFFSMAPGYMPWDLTGAEARLMTQALRQTLEIAPRVRDNPELLPDLEGPGRGEFLVRVPRKTADGYTWGDEIQPAPPPVAGPVYEATFDQDEAIRLGETLGASKNFVVEIDFFNMASMPIGDRGERPFIPSIVFIADATSGMLLNMDTVRGSEAVQASIDGLLAVIERVVARPASIRVRLPVLETVLKDLGQFLDVKVELKKHLPMVDKARKALDDFQIMTDW
jgi:hypothetical protein